MLYGQFIYGWREYATADFTEELAASLTNSSSSFTASSVIVVKAEAITFPESEFFADSIRVRLIQYDDQVNSSSLYTANKIVAADLDITSLSYINSDAYRLRQASFSVDAITASTVSGNMTLSIDMTSDSESDTIATANFLSNIYATLESSSTCFAGLSATYDGDSVCSVDAGVLCSANLLYNKYIKQNEEYSYQEKDNENYYAETKDNETYSVQTKGNESYTEVTKGNETYGIL